MKSTRRWWFRFLAIAIAGVALACEGEGPSKQGLHKDCSDGSPCKDGQLCLRYSGIAGQPLSTCEIPCTYPSDCPTPLECVAVSDGPDHLICQ